MLIKMSTEHTRQIKFQSQPPGQFWWEDGSSAWCTWARSPPVPSPGGACPLLPGMAAMLQQWCCGCGSLRTQLRGGLWGKVVAAGLIKDDCGGKKKSQTSLQVGERYPSPPRLCRLSQGTSSADGGCCHIHLPLTGVAGTPILSPTPHSLC